MSCDFNYLPVVSDSVFDCNSFLPCPNNDSDNGRPLQRPNCSCGRVCSIFQFRNDARNRRSDFRYRDNNLAFTPSNGLDIVEAEAKHGWTKTDSSGFLRDIDLLLHQIRRFNCCIFPPPLDIKPLRLTWRRLSTVCDLLLALSRVRAHLFSLLRALPQLFDLNKARCRYSCWLESLIEWRCHFRNWRDRRNLKPIKLHRETERELRNN